MSSNIAEVKRLEVSGSFGAMGHAHGEECRNLIVALFEDRRDILFREVPSLQAPQLENACRSIWGYMAERHVNIADEVGAIAASAHLQPWQLIIAGAYTDLLDVCRTDHLTEYAECTLGVGTSPRFIAGTWDSHKSAGDALLLLTRRPDIGPSTLALTTAGWPAQQGINSYGLAFAITNLTPRLVTAKGLPYIAANALLAAARTPDEFIEVALRERFCSGHSYVLVGSEGAAKIVETTGAGVAVETVSGFTTKANHYRDGSSLDNNECYPFLRFSRERENELRALLAGRRAPAAFARAVKASSSVNRTDDRGTVVTCAYFFLNPDRRELWYQRGPARNGRMSLATLS